MAPRLRGSDQIRGGDDRWLGLIPSCGLVAGFDPQLRPRRTPRVGSRRYQSCGTGSRTPCLCRTTNTSKPVRLRTFPTSVRSPAETMRFVTSGPPVGASTLPQLSRSMQSKCSHCSPSNSACKRTHQTNTRETPRCKKRAMIVHPPSLSLTWSSFVLFCRL